MRAFFVGAVGLSCTLVAIGCGGGGSPGASANDGGSEGGSDGAGGDDGSAPGNDGGGQDAHPIGDAGGQDAQDASMKPDGAADSGPGAEAGPGDAAPDAPAWTGYGVLAAGVEATWFTTLGSTIYFGGKDAAHGNELWTTDLTPTGTTLLFDACPGTCDGFKNDMVQVNGHILFSAVSTASNGFEGAAYVLPPSGTPTALNAILGAQGFAGSTLVCGWQFGLYATDGTPAGTSSLSGLGNDHPEEIAGIGTRALVVAGQANTSPVIMDLWGTDGTSAGLVELETGGATNRSVQCASNGKGYVVADNTLLTITDGTAAGTQTGVGGAFTQLAWFGVLASGTVIFQAHTGVTATSGLYVSDGTTITQIGPEGPDGPPVNLGSVAVFNSLADVLVTDGTVAGTSVLTSFPSTDVVTVLGAAGSYVYFYVVPFTAQAGVQPQLWKTDGTAAGTALVADLAFCPSTGCGQSDFYLQRGIGSGNTIAFVVQEGNGPYTFHLWSSGGTAATTHVVSDSLSQPAYLPVGNGVLFSTTANDLRYEPL